MGCNAWNHPSDCDCGWGGQWHGNDFRVGTNSKIVNDNKINAFYAGYWTYNRRINYESYVNPNARCPVCGKSVFFYQSEYGGRVFFDELGPPWPKHPCTDSSVYEYVPVPYLSPAKPEERKIKWQDEGWEPVSVLNSDVKGDLAVLRIRRIDSDGMEINLSSEFTYPLGKDALVFIRETDDLGIFEISYLDTLSKVLSIEPKQVIAFRNCYTAYDYATWQRAQSGNASAQNGIARNLLFLNVEDGVESIDVNNQEIDIDAAKYWLEKAARSGSKAAAQNLKVLKIAALKARLEANPMLGIETLRFEPQEDRDCKKPEK